jgi:hypothetical protein
MPGFEAGPSGGSGGEPFTDVLAVPARAPLTVVEVRAANVIDSVQVTYRRRSGDVSLGRHGGTGGQLQRLELRDGEFIQRLSGTYANVVDSIAIDTNLRRGALRAGGKGGGATFVYEAAAGLEIAGFLGRAGTVLDAIGPIYRGRIAAGSTARFRAGPVGGQGGRAFSDGPLLDRLGGSQVARVFVRGDRFVDAVQVSYRSGGDVVAGRRHGGSGGQEHGLDLARGEYITAVSGIRGTVVDQLVVDTNRRERALVAGYHLRYFEPRSPFGAFYRFEAPPGTAIVGFFGRSGTFVDALGVIYGPR